MPQPRAALSVDVEFFSHLPAYRRARGTTDQMAVGHDGIDFLLNAFAESGGSGTFFTVSEIAETHPETIATIADRHELGSHTHTHRHLSELSPDQRRAQLVDSKRQLEATSGADVTGFRAPSFDFADDHFEMLADIGYEYDSSIVPCRSIPGWYGGEYETQQPVPAGVVSPGAPDALTEVPVAVMPGLRLPLTGTWIRFFGVRYTILGMELLARQGIAPVLYVHPWELVDLPAVEGVPSRVYWRTGEYMRRAVRRILDSSFEFVPVGQIAEESTSGGSGYR
ncbi:polysaccharide deacetylase family protein [Salinibaculum salinum]|uniref:polysaccharide deacetylase family protein n=1 Tax=Salinibaculum salinum TaxID=3131996 RepID=UPI0030ED4B82